MTVFATTNGQRMAVGSKLTTTNATTILTSTADITYTVENIIWSTDTAGSTFSLWWSSGGTDYYLVRTETEAANTRDQITDLGLVLRNGMTLKAQAGTASKIDVTVVAIQSMKTQQQ